MGPNGKEQLAALLRPMHAYFSKSYYSANWLHEATSKDAAEGAEQQWRQHPQERWLRRSQ